MKIIEQIEIKNFRSFGNRKKSKTQIIKLNELNIFSWSNDSWKSNILRALNLFFNWNTYLDTFLDFKNDFFKKEKRDDDDIDEEMITIKISFINEENKWKNKNNDFVRLPEKFWVSRKFLKTSRYSSYNQDDWVETSFRSKNEKWIKDIKKSDFYEEKDNKFILKQNVRASLSRQLSIFLDSIYFHYVPAIKDKNYFSYLYWELQKTLLKEKDSELDKTKVKFQDSIQKSTEKLMNEFKNVVNNDNINITPIFELPDLVDLFKSLNLNTWKVELKYRWDWIQAKLIPEILNFISVKEQTIKSSNIKKWEKPKKYFIWWFEEPENSYEYRNAQILSDRFKDIFVKNSQIFITTHSFNFLSINTNPTSIYRVWKDNKIESSRVLKVKNIEWVFIPDQSNYDWEDFDLLNDELWFLSLNNELERLYKEKEQENRQLLIESIKLKEKAKEIIDLKPDNVFICEDKNWPKVWEHFLKEYWINIDKIIPSEWCTKFDWEDWFLKTDNLSKNPNLKIFRQNDRDWLMQKQVNFIETEINIKYNELNYKFLHLPVNEIENFYIVNDDYFTDILIKKNKNDLEDDYFWTIQKNFNDYNKKYKNCDLFKFDDKVKISNQCRQEADLNIKQFYPWKDIKKLKPNLNIESEFLKWTLNDFPQELKYYLEEIKTFFNS